MHDDLAPFLTRFWEALSVAESSGDLAHVAPLCADNLVFVSPSAVPYETLDELIAAWWTPPESYSIRFDTTEVISSDGMAMGRGIATDSSIDEDGEPVGHRYNYVAVFGRDSSGWRLTHFISNMID